MAKKKAAPRKAPSNPVLSHLQTNLKELQVDAQAVLSRVRKEAVRLSHEQKRALDRVVGDAKQLRADLEKLVKQTTTDLEARAKRFLSSLEKDAKHMWRSK